MQILLGLCYIWLRRKHHLLGIPVPSPFLLVFFFFASDEGQVVLVTELVHLFCSGEAMAHFTPFEVGQIKVHAYHGLGAWGRASGAPRGASGEPPGSFWRASRDPRGASGEPLGSLEGVLGVLWEVTGEALGSFRRTQMSFWRASGEPTGLSWERLRLLSIVRNNPPQ